MRLTALSLVTDRLDLYNQIINCESLRNIKDSNGNKMTDYYLSTVLDKRYPGFRLKYENSSGFIHFSNEDIDFNTDFTRSDNEFVVSVRFAETTEFSIQNRVDYAYNMFYLGKNLYSILNGYKLHMIEFMCNIKHDM